MEANLRAVEDEARRTDEVLVHLNHQTLDSITAEDLAFVGQDVFEVYNGHPSINHLGDNTHPAVERLWDIANTIRLSELTLHHYSVSLLMTVTTTTGNLIILVEADSGSIEVPFTGYYPWNQSRWLLRLKWN